MKKEQTQYKGNFLGFSVYTDPSVEPGHVIINPDHPSPLHPEVAAQIEANNRLEARIDKLTTERDQAMKQVAALVSTISEIHAACHGYGLNVHDLIAHISGISSKVFINTQATADAFTAKVRLEAIEECVAAIQVTRKETIALAEEYYKINGHTHRCYKYQVDGIDKATIKTKSLLPKPAEAAEKGGN